MPRDDGGEMPPRPGAWAEGKGAPDDGRVALLVDAGTAVFVVTAALAQYVLGLALASVKVSWRRLGEVASQVRPDSFERVPEHR